jgi:hypothetical protein
MMRLAASLRLTLLLLLLLLLLRDRLGREHRLPARRGVPDLQLVRRPIPRHRLQHPPAFSHDGGNSQRPAMAMLRSMRHRIFDPCNVPSGAQHDEFKGQNYGGWCVDLPHPSIHAPCLSSARPRLRLIPFV